MTTPTATILLVEDERAHAELIKRNFTIKTPHLELIIAHSLRQAREILDSTDPDLIITDFMLPDGNGTEFLADRTANYPIVVMTSHGDEQIAVEAMKAGALDYVVKTGENLASLPRIAERALREWSHIHERQQAERALRDSERRFRSIVEQSAEAIVLTDHTGRIVEWNNAAVAICGFTREDALGQAIWDVYHELTPEAERTDTQYELSRQTITEALQTGSSPWMNQVQDRTFQTRQSEQLREVEILMFPIKVETGIMLGSIFRDVTESKEAEQRLRQQDRLAAVGQLAAGIAHDFNNIMAVIVLYAQTSLMARDLPPRVQERLATIVQQATRATELIQQILDFSRRTILERRPLPLVPIVKEQVKLWQRTMPENITIQLDYQDDNLSISADPTRIQQALMNLVLNARDAMPDGGHLTIGIDRHMVNPNDKPIIPPAGSWIAITVADTGTGIAPEVLPHLFEPFFTTKGPGKGTGLGLAQVYGIVKQHEGHVDVDTAPGKGTRFNLYLPALEDNNPTAENGEMDAFPAGDLETILIVEDDEATRQAMVDSLSMLNYHVLAASNGREALFEFDKYGERIELVVSDVVMPDMGGIDLVNALRRRQLQVPVLLLTGHPLHERMDALQTEGMAEWLPKPLELPKLAHAIHQMLHRRALDRPH